MIRSRFYAFVSCTSKARSATGMERTRVRTSTTVAFSSSASTIPARIPLHYLLGLSAEEVAEAVAIPKHHESKGPTPAVAEDDDNSDDEREYARRTVPSENSELERERHDDYNIEQDHDADTQQIWVRA